MKNSSFESVDDNNQHLQLLLGSALNATVEGVVITDTRGVIKWVNPACTELTGYTFDEIVGKHTRILKSGKQDAEFYTELWQTICAGKVWYGELWNRRKDGSLYLAEQSITPVVGEDGEIVHYIAVKRDITECFETQKRLQQGYKMEAIGQLTAGIAHNFNNKLATIMGYTELLSEQLVQYKDPELLAHLDEILIASTKARDLIREMISFSNSKTGEHQSLQIVPVIKESLKILSSTLPASITLSTKFSDELSQVRIDPVLIHQMIMSLCINARNAMKDNGVLSIETHHTHIAGQSCNACHESFSGEYVELSISDAGHGITTADMQHIFEPFFTTRGLALNNGMGLSVLHGMLHEQGGHVLVESMPGKGARFRLLFPAIDLSIDAHDDETDDFSKPVRQRSVAHILVVDDEVSFAKFIRELLESHDYTVTVLHDGKAALALFKNNPDAFDLLITDQTMPGLIGSKLIKALHAINPKIPVILMSGHNDPIDANESVDELIPQVRLLKPFSNIKIVNEVENLLQA